jgi:hypothetical protein
MYQYVRLDKCQNYGLKGKIACGVSRKQFALMNNINNTRKLLNSGSLVIQI